MNLLAYNYGNVHYLSYMSVKILRNESFSSKKKALLSYQCNRNLTLSTQFNKVEI